MTSSANAPRLQGQVAIVTGGVSGFGKAVVDTFIEQGAKVLVMDLNANEGGGGLKDHDETVGQQLKANVCSAQDWKTAVEICQSKFGQTPTICVNNAGWTYSNKSTLTVTEEEFDKVFNVNAKSFYVSVNTLVPIMQKAGKGGSFIQVASTAGVRPRPNLTWYNASKAAVIAANKSMALEFAKDKIRFNCVNPVAGVTPMLSLFAGAAKVGDALTDAQLKQFNDSVPLGRLSMPADVANAVLFFADPKSEFLTGLDLNVDGGRCV
ncbi:NAD(P)-binding protein [Meira miltonrushii]|uniref:NAD(P)-binding protein n=1 Tax=Meira miltonrushii TaxID=1280837 RepID=A0A316VFB6_9BASI|nr:NAD(P)-binding protein [Meira miltonrushii]PWN34165.1 NAD(P)-binding protein [Meira miltonrushii]